jgi:hypothetical protein
MGRFATCPSRAWSVRWRSTQLLRPISRDRGLRDWRQHLSRQVITLPEVLRHVRQGLDKADPRTGSAKVGTKAQLLLTLKASHTVS